MTRQQNALRPVALTTFEAVCEALYPENDFGAPSWRDTDMVARAAVLWDELPPMSRLTLEALYTGLRPLAALAPARRLKVLDNWRRSRIWPLRFVAEAVKSSSTMVYLSHPAAIAYIGVRDNCVLGAVEEPAPVEKRGIFKVVAS